MYFLISIGTIWNIVALVLMFNWALEEALNFLDSDILFFPLLVNTLREFLNIPGTVIATIIFSILFAPAIVVYFILLALGYILVFSAYGFVLLFRRKDT